MSNGNPTLPINSVFLVKPGLNLSNFLTKISINPTNPWPTGAQQLMLYMK
jgi:hypothetical protein